VISITINPSMSKRGRLLR